MKDQSAYIIRGRILCETSVSVMGEGAYVLCCDLNCISYCELRSNRFQKECS